ncbi:putative thioesterase involved in non-ribosomal peptide biosynthesis [Cylindrospermum stagnale PCC 7417]|uniref:Putative thioesterase involved in non-ribosomal peptide biosynthesis n=1 Tax=Cylindrospermum stagnale PCC 7417 TaxID=56107 RepID=K9WTS9_9NOST|nr:thioesterase II family protein [Cylindrospermum stagnale]AFZ23209.1 putative thioesterase involved in non-ribosomal peptide biosynthesis [Cylindrospermum stagnale PCC 7417]
MTNKSPSNSWIICHKPNPQAKLRLFCLPYAGSSAAIYRSWSEGLPGTVEVCAVELPGRGRRMKLPPITRLETLVSEIAENMTPFLDKPFAIFGHSMGALISFELTHLLRSQYGLTPLHLFISARRAPQIPRTKRPIHNLPEAEFLEELRCLNGTPKAVLKNEELMQVFLPVLRADFAVLETYVYTQKPTIDCPVSVFGGLQDQEVSYDDLLGWQEQAMGTSFSLQMIEGDHFFIHSAQAVLLQSLGKKLL